MAKRLINRQRNEQVEPSAGDAASELYPKRSLGTEWISDDLLEDTRRVWSKQYGRPISPEEAIEICVNVKRFAELLVKIKRENETNAAAQATTVSAVSNSE